MKMYGKVLFRCDNFVQHIEMIYKTINMKQFNKTRKTDFEISFIRKAADMLSEQPSK